MGKLLSHGSQHMLMQNHLKNDFVYLFVCYPTWMDCWLCWGEQLMAYVPSDAWRSSHPGLNSQSVSTKPLLSLSSTSSQQLHFCCVCCFTLTCAISSRWMCSCHGDLYASNALGWQQHCVLFVFGVMGYFLFSFGYVFSLQQIVAFVVHHHDHCMD